MTCQHCTLLESSDAVHHCKGYACEQQYQHSHKITVLERSISNSEQELADCDSLVGFGVFGQASIMQIPNLLDCCCQVVRVVPLQKHGDVVSAGTALSVTLKFLPQL